MYVCGVCVFVSMCGSTYIYIYKHIYVCLCPCVVVHIYIYIYIYIHVYYHNGHFKSPPLVTFLVIGQRLCR